MKQVQKTSRINRIAQGSWQEEVWDWLLSGHPVTNPISALQGQAKSWSIKYKSSLENMLKRASDAGYTITFTHGPRGGEWGGHYRLVASPIKTK